MRVTQIDRHELLIAIESYACDSETILNFYLANGRLPTCEEDLGISQLQFRSVSSSYNNQKV